MTAPLNVAFLRERLNEMAGQVQAERMVLVRDPNPGEDELRYELLTAVWDSLTATQSLVRALAAADAASASAVSRGMRERIIGGQQATIGRMSQERRDAIGARR